MKKLLVIACFLLSLTAFADFGTGPNVTGEAAQNLIAALQGVPGLEAVNGVIEITAVNCDYFALSGRGPSDVIPWDSCSYVVDGQSKLIGSQGLNRETPAGRLVRALDKAAELASATDAVLSEARTSARSKSWLNLSKVSCDVTAQTCTLVGPVVQN